MNRRCHLSHKRAQFVCQHVLSLIAGVVLVVVAFFLGAAMTGPSYHATDAAPVIHKSDKVGRMIDV